MRGGGQVGLVPSVASWLPRVLAEREVAPHVIRIRYRGSRELRARAFTLGAVFRTIRREVWTAREAALRGETWPGYG